MKRLALVVIALLLITGCSPGENEYAACVEAFADALNKKDFDSMYALVANAPEVSKDVFINRYKNIYGSVEAADILVKVLSVQKQDGGARRVRYEMSMETVAGALSFENYADVSKTGGEYKLHWGPHIIFPDLTAERPVKVTTLKAKSGAIYDRDGRLLAGDGIIKAVGIVKEKMSQETFDADLQRIADLVGTTYDALNKELNAAWVKEGLVVPVAELMESDVSTKEALLQIPGIKISDKKGRIYPKGREFSQEDKYLDRLRGKDGHRITITDASGNVLKTLIEQPPVDGESIKLDISAGD